VITSAATRHEPSAHAACIAGDGSGAGSVVSGWIERARPLLGTLVRIGVGGLDATAAHAAIDRGFAAIDAIHALMSFHEPSSDVSRANRDAASRDVVVDPRTLAVIRLALEVASASAGRFDVTVAAQLVDTGFLPSPVAAPRPDPAADWRDIEIAGDALRFRRQLWVDLGGIAKGYAVDAALEAMALPAPASACVDAGGDLRVVGPAMRRVILNAPAQSRDALPVLELRDGALASSSGFAAREQRDGRWRGAHVAGRDREAAPVERFAAVVASRCAVADALTKVALFTGDAGAGDATDDATFARFGATAHVFDLASGWRSFGATA
jgi:thiamine biosynthesis lipoprotein